MVMEGEVDLEWIILCTRTLSRQTGYIPTSGSQYFKWVQTIDKGEDLEREPEVGAIP